MKREVVLMIIITLVGLSLLACGKKEEPEEATSNELELDENIRRFEDVGIEISIPKDLGMEKIDAYASGPEENVETRVVVSFIPDEVMAKAKLLNEKASLIPESETEKIQVSASEIMDLTNEFRELFLIASIDKTKEKGKLEKDLFENYDKQEFLGEVDNFKFYLIYNDEVETDGLVDKSKAEYEEIHSRLEEFKKGIKLFKPITEQEKLSKYKQLKFDAKTLDGDRITDDIFKENKLTMVNIWATYCTPCIAEMPDLQELYEELKADKVGLIAIVSDTPDPDNEALAKNILSTKGVKFKNIIPDEQINESILKDLSGVPTSFFVDENGNIIGDFIVGSKTKAEFKKEIELRLEMVK